MFVSARNKLFGKVVGIQRGDVTSVVKVELQGSPVITAVITNDGLEEMKLSEGGQGCAVIKASDVMLGVCESKEPGGCGCQNAG